MEELIKSKLNAEASAENIAANNAATAEGTRPSAEGKMNTSDIANSIRNINRQADRIATAIDTILYDQECESSYVKLRALSLSICHELYSQLYDRDINIEDAYTVVDALGDIIKGEMLITVARFTASPTFAQE